MKNNSPKSMPVESKRLSALPLNGTEALATGGQIGQLLDLLDDAGGASHGDGPGLDVPADDAGCADGAALADGDAGEDDGAAADPAVVADDDGARELDVLAPRRHLRLVRRREYRHVRPEHHSVPDHHQRAVQDHRAVFAPGVSSERETWIKKGEGRWISNRGE
jgi:hypothetical protein